MSERCVWTEFNSIGDWRAGCDKSGCYMETVHDTGGKLWPHEVIKTCLCGKPIEFKRWPRAGVTVSGNA